MSCVCWVYKDNVPYMSSVRNSTKSLNVGTMMDKHLLRWSINKPTMSRSLVSAVARPSGWRTSPRPGLGAKRTRGTGGLPTKSPFGPARLRSYGVLPGPPRESWGSWPGADGRGPRPARRGYPWYLWAAAPWRVSAPGVRLRVSPLTPGLPSPRPHHYIYGRGCHADNISIWIVARIIWLTPW